MCCRKIRWPDQINTINYILNIQLEAILILGKYSQNLVNFLSMRMNVIDVAKKHFLLRLNHQFEICKKIRESAGQR